MFKATLKYFIIKEWIEGVRSYRIAILAIGIGFFALADPILTKLLPMLLSSQFEGMDLSALMDISTRGAMATHFKNLSQISLMVIVFTLMGLMATEKGEKTLIIPRAHGANVSGILMAKFLIYGALLMVITLIDVGVCYLYSGLLFESYPLVPLAVLKAAILQGLYFVYVLAVILLYSTLFKKAFVAGIFSLLTTFGAPLLGILAPWLDPYLPNQLLIEAQYYNLLPSHSLQVALVWTITIIVICLGLSCLKITYEEAA